MIIFSKRAVFHFSGWKQNCIKMHVDNGQNFDVFVEIDIETVPLVYWNFLISRNKWLFKHSYQLRFIRNLIKVSSARVYIGNKKDNIIFYHFRIGSEVNPYLEIEYLAAWYQIKSNKFYLKSKYLYT
jgi:hypothetical protein